MKIFPAGNQFQTQECKQNIYTPEPSLGQDLNGYYNIDPNFTFFHFDVDSNGNPVEILITPACLDCTFQGGSTVKPSFWQ